MKSSRPYLLRALYEWIVDSGSTPHILVSTEQPNVVVPAGYAKDGQIVLNISPTAVRYLEMGNELITFEGRFGGVSQGLSIPVSAVLAVYARENGQGMFFELDEPDAAFEGESEDEDAASEAPAPAPARSRSHLTVVK